MIPVDKSQTIVIIYRSDDIEKLKLIFDESVMIEKKRRNRKDSRCKFIKLKSNLLEKHLRDFRILIAKIRPF